MRTAKRLLHSTYWLNMMAKIQPLFILELWRRVQMWLRNLLPSNLSDKFIFVSMLSSRNGYEVVHRAYRGLSRLGQQPLHPQREMPPWQYEESAVLFLLPRLDGKKVWNHLTRRALFFYWFDSLMTKKLVNTSLTACAKRGGWLISASR